MLSWWLLPDSNWGHAALQAAALPAELKSLVGMRCSVNAPHIIQGNAPLCKVLAPLALVAHKNISCTPKRIN